MAFIIVPVSLPGPILFGAIFDSTCRVWQQSCDVTGSCWIYDNSSLAVRTLAGVLAFKALSLLFLTVASVVYKAPDESRIETDNNNLDDEKGQSEVNPAYVVDSAEDELQPGADDMQTERL